MKKISVLGVFMLINVLAFPQPVEKNLRINIGITQFITGSGFATGTELYFKINETSKRSLALGAYYCSEYKKVTGFTVNHEVFLLRDKQHKIEPLVFYNFIYRRTLAPQLFADMGEGKFDATYVSIEHHVGAGLRINLTQNVFISTKLGFGGYMGSVRKPLTDPILMNVSGGNGLSMMAKIGIGVTLF